MTENTGAKGRLVTAMLLFGTIGMFVRWIPLPSGVIALSRGVIGTLFLLLVIKVRHMGFSLPDIRRNLPSLCISGAFLGINWILLFEAYRYTSVAVATLCYYLAPVFVLLAAPVVFREKLTPKDALCACAAFFGMALASGVFTPGATAGTSAKGLLFGIGAALFYAAIVLISKRRKAISPFDSTIVQLLVSALVLLPYVLLRRDLQGLWTLPPHTWLLLLTVGIVHTGIAYALYFGSMQKLKAHTIAICSYIDPVLAILLSALVLKEPLSPLGMLGALLVLGAALCSELSPRGEQ